MHSYLNMNAMSLVVFSIIGQRIFGSHHRMFGELLSAMTVTIHALTLACGIETFTFAKPVEAAGWLGPASGISPTLVDDP